MKRVVIGNWKMNLNLAEATTLAHHCTGTAEQHHNLTIVIAPSLPWLVPIRESLSVIPPNFALASQLVSRESEGAYTGDVSAKQLKGIVSYCLVGHSERRRFHNESGPAISYQVNQLLQHSITPVICFGEMTQSQQKKFSTQIALDLKHDISGITQENLSRCLFAYEPLWAIGTGHPATADYIQRALLHVKEWSSNEYGEPFRILYGGSVTEANAALLGGIAKLDGLLVGGASLHGKQFRAVCSEFHPHV